MVLINRLFLGLVLLISPTWSLTNPTSTTYSTSNSSANLIINSTTNPPTTKISSTSPPIKKSRDESVHISPNESKTEINSSGTTSTEIPDEKSKNDSRPVENKGGRSFDIQSVFPGENTVFFDSDYEKELASRTREYDINFNIGLTTPESDSKFKQVQEDVLKKFDEREKIMADAMEEDKRNFFLNHEREEPKNHNVEGEDDFRMNEWKNVDVTEFSDKNNNKTSWVRNVESLKKSESIKNYNHTKIIDDNKTNVQNELKNEVNGIDADHNIKNKNKKQIDLDQESSNNQQVLNPFNTSNDEILINKRIGNQHFDQNKEISTKTMNDSKKVDEASSKIENLTKIDEKSTNNIKVFPKINDERIKFDEISRKMKTIDEDSTEIDQELIKITEISSKKMDKTNIDEESTIESITYEKSTIFNDSSKIEETTLNDQEITTEEINKSTPENESTDFINNAETTQNDFIETTTFGSFDESNTNFRELFGEILSNSTEIPPDTTTITTIKYEDDYDEMNDTTFYEITTDKINIIEKDVSKIEYFQVTEKVITNEIKKNETVLNVVNEILKESSPSQSSTSTSTSTTISTSTSISTSISPSTSTTTSASTLTTSESNEVKTISISTEKTFNDSNTSYKASENDIFKLNEINDTDGKIKKTTEKSPTIEEGEENEVDDPDGDENSHENSDDETEDHSNKPVVNYFDEKITIKPKKTVVKTTTISSDVDENNNVEDKSRFVNLSTEIHPIEIDLEVTTNPAGLVDDGEGDDDDGNGGKIAAIVISTVGAVCLFLLVGLLVVMRKRQKRFNYGQRCRPVSLDAYSMDNVSIHNSTRRKGVLMTSKRAYGNAAFDDPNSPSHPLNFSELVKFANNTEEIHTEFEEIPQVQAKTSELPEGCEVKNRYANVIPLPETRVFLKTLESDPTSDYINANYVTGAKSERRYYIACQAPLQSTISDFWRMIWEQESKVILMLTHLYEQGVEKCSDYLPPSEVLDCNRLFGDFQVTLKKREVRDKYIISNLQLKNMVSNSWREVTHIWYVEWPHKGVPDEANSLIRFLIEARSYMKTNEIKAREANTSFIQGTVPRNPPVIVHCSPGTGRTGTVISCDIAIREFEQSRQVDIPKIVYKIRRDRASSVQTKEQYSFIYKVINLYATKLTGGAFDSF